MRRRLSKQIEYPESDADDEKAGNATEDAHTTIPSLGVGNALYEAHGGSSEED